MGTRTDTFNYTRSGFQVSDFQAGFTLLELLISLSIIAVIVVIISAALRIGVSAWEKGERDVEARQRYRIVLDLMKRQLASVDTRQGNSNVNKLFLLKGDNKTLEFLSHISLVPGNDFGEVYVRYVVKPEGSEEKERLIFHEKSVVLPSKAAETDMPPEDEFYELIPEIQNMTFEYLKKGAEDWQQSWEPESDKGLPQAVGIILTEEPGSAPVRVIVRIHNGL
ncbi:prepilin-type N-terminal cleavage/methylation domain-containing protein [Desulfococcaceae bacterium HSG8]|nr:prepilin-type N-terminal cleavage/methylation domain-containing protein [Desulfococcaceae bacterium HSG8]